MTENERVKEIRKAKSLTLEEFGKRIGVGKSAISDIERGRNSLSSQTRLSICREFNINEEWLRTGEGEMENAPDEFSLDALAREHDATDLEKQLIKAFFELDKTTRNKFMDKLSDVFTSAGAREDTSLTASPGSLTPEEAHRRLDEHLFLEKRAAEESEASGFGN